MARNLLCKDCNNAMDALARRFNEYFESAEGKSNSEYKCDDCGRDIHIGDSCYASVLLTSKNYFQYENQKPQNWMQEYFL